MSELKIFTDDEDWYIARDMEHVQQLVIDTIGESIEELGGELKDWHELSADSPITVLWETDDFELDKSIVVPDGAIIEKEEYRTKVKALACEWIKVSSAGFFCGRNY